MSLTFRHQYQSFFFSDENIHESWNKYGTPIMRKIIEKTIDKSCVVNFDDESMELQYCLNSIYK